MPKSNLGTPRTPRADPPWKTSKPAKAARKSDLDDPELMTDFTFSEADLKSAVDGGGKKDQKQAGRKNRAYAIIQNDLQEKERKNKKMALTNERVTDDLYVDKTRNMAVVVGMKDVKSDMKDKNKRDRRSITVRLDDDDSDAGAFLTQGEMEMRNNCMTKAVDFFAKAIKLQPEFEQAYVQRSRCLLQMGENQLAIEDARKAVMISSQSIPALETLGRCLYTSAEFEMALVMYHRIYRLRKTKDTKEWINRCQETIKAFITTIQFDMEFLEFNSGKSCEEIFHEYEKDFEDGKQLQNAKLFLTKSDIIELKRKEFQEDKMTSLLMGKLKKDMDFLDKLVNESGLHKHVDKNLYKYSEKEKFEGKVRRAAEEGLNFLNIRRKFWETSEPPTKSANQESEEMDEVTKVVRPKSTPFRVIQAREAAKIKADLALESSIITRRPKTTKPNSRRQSSILKPKTKELRIMNEDIPTIQTKDKHVYNE